MVLVYPGVYSENLTLQKDGVTLQALGLVTLENAAAGDTLTISASTGATPKSVRLLGVRVTNDDPASACVRIIGADTFATGSLTVTAAPPNGRGRDHDRRGHPYRDRWHPDFRL